VGGCDCLWLERRKQGKWWEEEEGEGRTANKFCVVIEKHSGENEQQKRDVAYFLGWCFVQLKRWSDAIEVLS